MRRTFKSSSRWKGVSGAPESRASRAHALPAPMKSPQLPCSSRCCQLAVLLLSCSSACPATALHSAPNWWGTAASSACSAHHTAGLHHCGRITPATAPAELHAGSLQALLQAPPPPRLNSCHSASLMPPLSRRPEAATMKPKTARWPCTSRRHTTPCMWRCMNATSAPMRASRSEAAGVGACAMQCRNMRMNAARLAAYMACSRPRSAMTNHSRAATAGGPR
jgi:hypothetical protein